MSSRTLAVLLTFTFSSLTAAAGCGSNGTGTGGDGGGGASSSSSSSSGTMSSSSSSSGSSSSSSGSEPACTDFTPPAPASMPVTVRLVNKRDSNVYLGKTAPDCDVWLGFTLEDANMKQLQPSREACDFTCAELQQGSCACPAGCAAPIITLLAPGGHYDIGWPATVFESATMPDKCYNDAACTQTACLMELAAPAGPLTMKASAYDTALGCNGTCADCTPSPGGDCTIFGATAVGGTEIKGQATWNAGTGLVEIDFQ